MKFWLAVCLFSFPLFCDAGSMKGPKRSNTTHRVQQVGELSFAAQTGLILVRGFQKYISPADGPRSPSYPTGSQYGLQAIREEGLFWGLLMTGDRLFHEADVPMGPLVNLHNKVRFYDPPSSNRYWRKAPLADLK